MASSMEASADALAAADEQAEVIDLLDDDDNEDGVEEIEATEDDACCICQDVVSALTQGFLSSCEHRFHFDCIVTWSKVTNLCPLCKQKFNEVTKRDDQGAIAHREGIADTKQVFRPDPRDHDITAQLRLVRDVHCSICGRGDDEHVLLMCEALGCNNANHTYCIGLTEVPPNSWYCAEHSSAPARASDLIARPASTVSTRRRTRRLASLMSNIMSGVGAVRRGQTATTATTRSRVRARSGGRLAMPNGDALDLHSTRPIRGLALSYALRMSRELQAIQQRADTMFARGDLGLSALYAPPRGSILGTRSTGAPSQVDSMWDDYAQSRRLLAEATASFGARSSSGHRPRSNQISTSFAGEYREMAQRMTQAASNDNYASTVSLTIPKTGRLRLVSTMKAFFSKLNERERLAALESGCLGLFLSWLRPTAAQNGSASTMHLHPHVLEAVLTVLESLPVRKQDLGDVPQIRVTLAEVANHANVDLALRERCVMLSERWKEINPPVDSQSRNPRGSAARWVPLPSTTEHLPPSLPAIQTFSTQAPSVTSASSSTHHAKHSKSKKKKATSSDNKWSSLAVDYVKTKLYPVYKDNKFKMSKDVFKRIVKQVLERFRSDAAKMQSNLVATTASGKSELASIAKKRLMQLLDQVYKESCGKSSDSGRAAPSALTHDFSNYSAVPSSAAKRPRLA